MASTMLPEDDGVKRLLGARRVRLYNIMEIACGERADPSTWREARELARELRDRAKALRDFAKGAGSAHLQLEVAREVEAALALAAGHDARADAATPPDRKWCMDIPLPQRHGREADACRAVLLRWVEPEGAVIRLDERWRTDTLRLVVGLAFGRPKLLPKNCADTRSTLRLLDFDRRMTVDAAARAPWPFWPDEVLPPPNDDAPMMDARPYGGDEAVLREDSVEAAACRSVLAGAEPGSAAKGVDAGTATVLGLGFGRPKILPGGKHDDFRSSWRRLDCRQRRLVDAAARAAWPARDEPLVEGWW